MLSRNQKGINWIFAVGITGERTVVHSFGDPKSVAGENGFLTLRRINHRLIPTTTN